MKIRIALVDDHSLFRRGLMLLFASHPEIEVVAEAASGEEFLSLLESSRPDVVFMDYAMPGLSGAQTTAQALEVMPDLKVITLSMFGDNAYYTRMMECGAKGFLLKDSEFDELVEAVKTVHEGGTYFSASLLASLSNSLRISERQEVDEQDRLSEREVEILVAICRGLSTQEIADQLFISKRTVDKHRANILEKSGCKNSTSLVVYAIKNGLVEL
ncbi:MAG: response regulator transcription factor [Alistipes sp.]|nr:response regulator transcription factor [Alistipes sp.]